MNNDKDPWREAILIEIKRLQIERMKILTLDAKLAYNDLISGEDRLAMMSAIRIIDSDINRLQTELVLDDLLSGDFELIEGKIVKKD